MKLWTLLLLALLPGAVYAEPISAIAAIGSIVGSGVATVGIAGLTIAQGAMLAGGVLSLVGNIAGDQKLQKFGGLVSLGGGVVNAAQSFATAGTEAAKEAVTAGAEGLGQTAITPAQQVATEAVGATAEELAGLGAAPSGAAQGAAESAMAQATTAPSAASRGLVSGAQEVAPAAEPSLLDKLAGAAKSTGRFIKENKELVNLAGGAIKGAMDNKTQADLQRQRLEAETQALNDQRAHFSASVRGVNIPQNFVNPNVNILANRQVQDPMRYIPRRGLITQAQGG
jgi:hypothetical protein